jgi:hypothetical protein
VNIAPTQQSQFTGTTQCTLGFGRAGNRSESIEVGAEALREGDNECGYIFVTPEQHACTPIYSGSVSLGILVDVCGGGIEQRAFCRTRLAAHLVK